jgi:DNA processing protein
MSKPAPPLNMSEDERLARLRLIRSESIGAVTFWDLIDRFGSALAAIAALPDVSRKSAKARTLIPLDEARRELDALRAVGGTLIACGEAGYPAALAAVEMPPPLLSVRGSIDLLQRDMIAIVGARNASALGARFARQMAADLGAAGFVIASGLARGIDTAAHKGSLATGTCAVMAGGLDIVYPPENKSLYEDIVATGVAVSEMPFGLQPTAQHFPRRNRIISGLARGVVVVEAAENSGSLITARLAGEQGRDVFAVPGSPLDPRAKGTNGLLRQGAVLTESAEDVLTALRPTLERRPEAQVKAPKKSLDRREISGLKHEILERLGPAPVEIDELVRQMGASPAAVAAALLDLEFEGLLARHPGQKVALSGN